MSSIYVNDGYGYEEMINNNVEEVSKVDTSQESLTMLLFQDEYFPLVEQDYNWIPDIFSQPVVIGSDVYEASGGEGFSGSISCLQIFNFALDSATVHLKKHCPDLPSEHQAKNCPQGYDYYDGMCYKVITLQLTK